MNDGIKYGKGLFETIKVKDSKPIYWEDHIERLENSMNFLGINTNNLTKNIYEKIKNMDLNADW